MVKTLRNFLKVSPKFSPYTLTAIAGGLFIVSILAVVLIRAAGTRLYLAPGSAEMATSATLQVAIRVDSPDLVNAVQANVSYPADKLELVGVDYTGSAFGVQAEETKSSGLVKIARGVNGGSPSVTGDNLVATLTFRALVAGTANLSFATGSAVAKDDGTGTNILSSTSGSIVTIANPTTGDGSATLSLAPPSSTVAQNSPVRVEIWEDSGSAPVNAVQANLTYPASQIELASIDYTGSAFGVQAEETKTAGSINIARGINGGSSPVTGAALVAILNFKATGTGTAAVNFATGSAVVNATTNKNILTTMNGGSYSITPAADTTAPTVSITAPLNGATVSDTVKVAASASDNVGVARVELFDGATLLINDTAAPYEYAWNTTTASNGSHVLTAKAYDAAGNVATSPSVSVNVQNAAADKTAPTTPTNLRTSSTPTSTKVDLAWNASTDNTGGTGLGGYKLYRGGNLLATITAPATTYSDTTVSASTSYSYTVSAYDKASPANESAQSSPPLSVTTPASPDTTAPTKPTLSASATTSAINLSWTASSDASGIAKYYVYRSTSGTTAAVIAEKTASTLTHSDTTASPGQAYSYYVQAVDNAGLYSGPSNTVSVVMPTAADTTAPSIPQNLTAAAYSSTQINLSWSSSTDNVGVTGYRVYRSDKGLAYIATVTSTSFGDAGLTPGTSYTYYVTAIDAAGNSSSFSNPATATTLQMAAGDGLTGAYYDKTDFRTHKFTRIDPIVNFAWGTGSPARSIKPDSFSVRWTGRVVATKSENYTFYTTTDDGARLWVNGQLLIDKWVSQPATEHSGNITLTAGQSYDIKLEYYEGSGSAVAQLRWSSPSTPKQIIPQSQLWSR